MMMHTMSNSSVLACVGISRRVEPSDSQMTLNSKLKERLTLKAVNASAMRGTDNKFIVDARAHGDARTGTPKPTHGEIEPTVHTAIKHATSIQTFIWPTYLLPPFH